MPGRNKDGSRKQGNKGSATEPHKRKVYEISDVDRRAAAKAETGTFERKIGSLVYDSGISPTAFVVTEYVAATPAPTQEEAT